MELTLNRLLYLLYLNRAEESDRTVTKMAKLYQVSKSTVSRNMDYLMEQGIVYADTMKLTTYGEKLAERYSEEVQLFERWIGLTAPCGAQTDRENAMKMAVYLGDDMKKQILQKIRLSKMFHELHYRGSISFSEFVKDMEEGNYPVSFVIYREEFRQGKFFSMADRGFAHPAILNVSGNTGMFQLKAVTMERRNVLDNLLMSGKLMKLEYQRRGQFEPVTKEGDIYLIPADALEYNFHQEENLLIGNLMLQIYAPLANKKLHKKRAVLSVIVHAI